MDDSIPNGKLKRSSLAAITAAKVGSRQLSHAVKRPFLSAEKRHQHEQTTDTANAGNGRKLAIKVQYPGIDATIHSDIQLVRQLTKMMRDSDKINEVLSEIEARMQEETDYRLEAENARWFDQHLAMDRVVIPAIYETWSSKHLLCMEHLDGMHLQPWQQSRRSNSVIWRRKPFTTSIPDYS